MGDSAESLMTCEPILMRPQWVAFCRGKQALSANFVNPMAVEHGTADRRRLEKPLLPSRGTRKVSKQHMLHNDVCPEITVNPQTFEVKVDGKVLTCEPAKELPLTQRYMLR